MLARDWGITNKEEGVIVIKGLFDVGCAVEDKSVKAWNFSRAMMLCDSLYKANWIDKNESVEMQYAMAPAVQQSFTSWEEFNDNYMIGYRRWAKTVGSNQETIELREKAYSTSNYIINENNEDKWIPWDKELVKYW